MSKDLLSFKKVESILKKHFSRTCIIEKNIDGFKHDIYLFKTKDNKEYILKIPKKIEKSKLPNEQYALEIWNKHGINVPKIKFCSKEYLIEDYIKGERLDIFLKKNKSNNLDEMYENLNNLIKKVHSIKGNGFGFLDENHIGKFNSWEEFIIEDSINNLNKLKENNIIDTVTIDKIRVFLNNLKENGSLDCDTPYLLHADLNPKNIIIKDNKKIYLIDGGDCIYGDPNYDLAILKNISNELFTNIFKSEQNKINIKSLENYEILHQLWLINLYHKENLTIDKNNAIEKLNNLIK